MKINRRTFLKKAAGTLFLSGFAGFGYGNAIEPELIVIERQTIRVARLPSGLEGLRIAILSDFHLQPFTQLPHILRAIDHANSLQPDLVVLLGDFVDATVEAMDDLAPALGRLNARYGIFAVLGNHDHWKGAAVVQHALERQGIIALRSRGVSLPIGRSELYMAGIDSVWAGQPNLDLALANHRRNAPIILLAHEPDFADTAAADGRIALQLSGHSHGGQVRLPLIGALQLPCYGKRYDQGFYRVKEMALYTNRGIGVVDIPVRINCPPEVTEITLAGS